MTLVPEPTKTFFQQFGSMVNFAVSLFSLVTLLVSGSILYAETQRNIADNKKSVDRLENHLVALTGRVDQLTADRDNHKFRLDVAERTIVDRNVAAARTDEKLTTLLTDVGIIKSQVSELNSRSRLPEGGPPHELR